MDRLKLVVADLCVQLASGCESTANNLDLATSLLRSTLWHDSEQVSGLLELKWETLTIVIDTVCGDLDFARAMNSHFGRWANDVIRKGC